MAQLTDLQLSFLATQRVPLEKTYDADGVPTWLYQMVMRSGDLWIAYGVKPCKRVGHTLRTRNGTCAQCDTRQLAFLTRWNAPGHIYVVYSAELETTKIGVATDPHKRLYSLNRIGYGGARDWNIFKSATCANMGSAEHHAHSQLAGYATSREYLRDGKLVSCNELFDTSPDVAWKAVQTALETAA